MQPLLAGRKRKRVGLFEHQIAKNGYDIIFDLRPFRLKSRFERVM